MRCRLQLVDLGHRQRVEFTAERQGQQVVGQLRVAHQDRTVRVGADHAALDRALGAVVAVADADLHRGQRGRRAPPW